MPELRDQIIKVIKTVFDPEIPVNVYDLGLIYDLTVRDAGDGAIVEVRMTLTSPNCPVADKLPMQVRDQIKTIDGVTDAIVTLVWEPPWTEERLSDLARSELESRGLDLKSPHTSATRMTGLSIGRTNRSQSK